MSEYGRLHWSVGKGPGVATFLGLSWLVGSEEERWGS